MSSPFPGMDPYLEAPHVWPDFHQRLITYAADQLNDQLRPRYVAVIGERIYLEAEGHALFPDVALERATRARAPGSQPAADTPQIVLLEPDEVREVFLEVRTAGSAGDLVTAIEVLSPTNKRPGEGRAQYLRKQAEMLSRPVHLVEIDLLRGGEPTVALPEAAQKSSAYRVVVSRVEARGQREFYGIRLDQRLPRPAIPLRRPDSDAVLDLQSALELAYVQGSYAWRVDYAAPVPPPALSAPEATWVQSILAVRQAPQ